MLPSLRAGINEAFKDNIKDPLFLHKSCRPISERPFENAEQLSFDLKSEVCEGGCWT